MTPEERADKIAIFCHMTPQEVIDAKKAIAAEICAAVGEIDHLKNGMRKWETDYTAAKETNKILHEANEEYKVNVKLMLKENAAAKEETRIGAHLCANLTDKFNDLESETKRLLTLNGHVAAENLRLREAVKELKDKYER